MYYLIAIGIIWYMWGIIAFGYIMLTLIALITLLVLISKIGE